MIRLSITIFSVALLISLVGTPLIRRLARSVGAIDQPAGYRKIHRESIPRMGGVVIFLAFFATLFSWVFIDSGMRELFAPESGRIAGIFLGALVVLIVGLVDDIRGVSPLVKVIFEILAGVIIFYAGYRITAIYSPIGPIRFGIFALPVTVLWIVFTCNAINLIDGMDGLATGVGLVASLTMFVVSALAGDMIYALPMAALAGAAVGFLVYNFYPASIFLGDSGSLLLGFLLGCNVLAGSYRHAAVGIAIPLIIFAVPIVDTGMAVLRRWSKRMPISSADRDHIHHRLLASGLSQIQAVGLIYMMTIFMGIVAIVLSFCTTKVQMIVVGILVIAFFVAFKVLKLTEFSLVSNRIVRDVKRTKQRTGHWELVQQRCNEIRYVRSDNKLRMILDQIFEGLDIDEVTLTTSVSSALNSGNTFEYTWMRKSDTSASESINTWTGNLPVRHKKKEIGRIKVVLNTERSELPNDISAHLNAVTEALALRLTPHKVFTSNWFESSDKETVSEETSSGSEVS